jgi:hypothetical protein
MTTIKLPANLKATAKANAAALGIAPNTKLSCNVWNMIHTDRSLGFAMNETAAYGIAWARQTGRLSGEVEIRLMSLRPYQKVQLATLVADRCQVIGDVPAFLNSQSWVEG